VLLLQHIIEVMEKKYFAGDADGRPRSYEAFCKAEIFDPLGLDASFSPPEGASRGHSQVSSDRLFRCDPQECVGGLWMNGQDMCKWLQLAPMMAGFRDICQHHMEHPSEELKDDWRRNGQGCMAVTFSDVGVPYLESEVSGFATGVYWLPQGHGTVGIMINNDRCGTALRKLIDERIGENLRGVAKAESFER
jgi:CubicO group peptidase (beta-lactamase class C family)